MNALEGRVAIITGAGRGIGREHALLFAAEGAKVVVNDLGGNPDGTGADASPAQQVVDEIKAAGGEAVANYDDVSDWDGAQRLIDQAVTTFGDLHVLVNNAGILRDRMLANMSDEEWDAIMRVHLRGHFCPTRWAAAYWRDQAKAGNQVQGAVINTSSTSGLFGNTGRRTTARPRPASRRSRSSPTPSSRRYGVRVNAIAPAAATRLTNSVTRTGRSPRRDEWSPMDPGNISPFVAYLATADCPINGRVFFVVGGQIHLFQPFAIVDHIEKDGRWTIEELQQAAPRLQDVQFNLNNPFDMLLGS